MKIWKVGERSMGACERCGRLVTTRFERRTVKLEHSHIDVPDVLVGVCEHCDAIVSIPPQSAPRLNACRERELVKIEGRIPQELDDVLSWLTAKYAGRLDAFRGALLRYYLNELAKSEEMPRRVKQLAASDVARSRQEERFHLRLDRHLLERSWTAAQAAGIEDKSEMIRGLILAAAEDTERPDIARHAALEALAVASA